MIATLATITVNGDDMGLEWPSDILEELLAYTLEVGEYTELDPDLLARLCQLDGIFCSNIWYVKMTTEGMRLFNDVFFKSEIN